MTGNNRKIIEDVQNRLAVYVAFIYQSCPTQDITDLRHHRSMQTLKIICNMIHTVKKLS